LLRSVQILFLTILLCLPQWTMAQTANIFSIDFYGDTVSFSFAPVEKEHSIDFLSQETVSRFAEDLMRSDFEPMVAALLDYQKMHGPDDWMYYQLVRRTAQAIYPKTANYYNYTLFKSFLLAKSGYDVALNIVGDKLLFFVQSGDEIFDVPSFKSEDKSYVCLNYHDYDFSVDFLNNEVTKIDIPFAEVRRTFSYRLSHLPEFSAGSYHEKELGFKYRGTDYHFKIKLNDEVQRIFTNYPVADYQLYFNQPLSTETYNSLIPQLKERMKEMSLRDGIDYLMHFTRYAFSYEADQEHFGREKHLSPEQTLLYDRSDCEDRAALFYCLVKEIYDRPMLVVAFPHHLTVAVKLDKPVGKQILYNGVSYTVCEPTPQQGDLPVGRLAHELRSVSYEVAMAYYPSVK
jgi:hypothetical protein